MATRTIGSRMTNATLVIGNYHLLRLIGEGGMGHAAALLELHKRKGVPWEPSDHGFVFPKDQVEAFAQRLMRLNQPPTTNNQQPITNNQRP